MIINDISNSRFFVDLPPSFTTVSGPTDSDGSDNQGSRKRTADPDPAKEKRSKKNVQNEDQIEEFKLKPGESWRDNICGKCTDDRPAWKGHAKVKMCIRWHIKGDCFGDCKHKDSHVPANEVPEKEKGNFRKFLKKVRGD